MPYHYADWKAETHHFVEPLSTRLPKELGCAFTASFLVSPIVSILDKAMVKEISGVIEFMTEIKQSTMEMFVQPKKFFGGLSFRLTFAVYAGTYAVANCSELLLDAYRVAEDKQRKPIKVGLSSIANVSLLLWRDSIFARVYSGKPKPSTPLRTLSMFALRDTATMTATFYAAPIAAKYLVDEHGMDVELARISSALVVPGITQIITAPIHIHALDYYTRPVVDSTAERFLRIKEEFRKIAFARTLRILPAFGLGSYSNNKFREIYIKEQPLHTLQRRRITSLVTDSSTVNGGAVMASSSSK
jgi:hypothetical protein